MNVIYLFVYFYFPFCLFYFHWVWWIYNLKHFYVLCTKFCRPLPPPILVSLSPPLHGWDSQSRTNEVSTTPPQKPEDSEDPVFHECYARKWSHCTPWKIITSHHSIISLNTWILSSFFTVADLEDSVFVTKLDVDKIWAMLVTFKLRTCYISVCSVVPVCSLTT